MKRAEEGERVSQPEPRITRRTLVLSSALTGACLLVGLGGGLVYWVRNRPGTAHTPSGVATSPTAKPITSPTALTGDPPPDPTGQELQKVENATSQFMNGEFDQQALVDLTFTHRKDINPSQKEPYPHGEGPMDYYAPMSDDTHGRKDPEIKALLLANPGKTVGELCNPNDPQIFIAVLPLGARTEQDKYGKNHTLARAGVLIRQGNTIVRRWFEMSAGPILISSPYLSIPFEQINSQLFDGNYQNPANIEGHAVYTAAQMKDAWNTLTGKPVALTTIVNTDKISNFSTYPPFYQKRFASTAQPWDRIVTDMFYMIEGISDGSGQTFYNGWNKKVQRGFTPPYAGEPNQPDAIVGQIPCIEEVSFVSAKVALPGVAQNNVERG